MKYLLLLVLTSPLFGNTLEIDPDRFIKLQGEVNEKTISVASEIEKLYSDNDDNIYLLLNSPGGSVLYGNIVIAAIEQAKSRGIEVICLSTAYAHSMAFNIMLECSKAVVLKSTSLVFHPVRIKMIGTAKDLMQRAHKMHLMDLDLINRISAVIGTSPSDIAKMYYAEKEWTGIEFFNFQIRKHFIIADKITGVIGLFK